MDPEEEEIKKLKPKKPPLTEEEKKKKFGNAYDPNYTKKHRGNGPRNPWQTYAINEEIAEQVANIPYNVLAGVTFDLGADAFTFGSPTSTLSAKPERQQALMVITYMPSIGIAEDRTDGINMSAVQLYERTRRKNSGAKVYESPDLMMYVLAMRDIYGVALFIGRALKLASKYEVVNKSIPDILLTALNVDPIDLRGNRAQYSAQYNALIERINTFPIPRVFPCFDREDFVESNVFMDSSSLRGQMYVYRREGYYLFTPEKEETGTSLTWNWFKRPVAPNFKANPLSYYLTILEEQVNAVFEDVDAQTMQGDLMKAFEKEPLYQLKVVGLDETIQFTFDEDALAQFENMRVALGQPNAGTGSGATGYELAAIGIIGNLNITQKDNNIVFTPTISTSGSATTAFVSQTKTIINSHKDKPDYRDNLEWTRLIVTKRIASTGSNAVIEKITSCGLEIPLRFECWRYTSGPSNSFNSYITTVGTNFNRPTGIEQFDWHPIIYEWSTHVSSGTVDGFNISGINGDLKVMTVIDDSTLQLINHEAVNAAFYLRHTSLGGESKG
nr:capsid protein [Rat picobirnavirus]